MPAAVAQPQECAPGQAQPAAAQWNLRSQFQRQCSLQSSGFDANVELLMQHRSERLAKYNQLLRIEEELGSAAEYAGENWRFIKWESA